LDPSFFLLACSNDGAYSGCETVNVLLQASVMSDVVALQQFVDKSEVELGSLPAANLTSMLDALQVSDVG
jgi:hypothetical protein